MLVRSASLLTKHVGKGEVEVHFSLPEWFGESHPMRLIHHRADATSSSDRLVTGDILHF